MERVNTGQRCAPSQSNTSLWKISGRNSDMNRRGGDEIAQMANGFVYRVFLWYISHDTILGSEVAVLYTKPKEESV